MLAYEVYLYVCVSVCGWGQSVFSLFKERIEAFALELFADTHCWAVQFMGNMGPNSVVHCRVTGELQH